MVDDELKVEIFKPVIIDGDETDYLVSDRGRVQNAKTGYFLKPYVSSDGYYHVMIYMRRIGNEKRKRRKYSRVSVLVSEAFIDNPKNKPTVNHKIPGKEGKALNSVEDLEWATYHEQNLHAYANGIMKPRRGEISHFCTITEETAHKICKLLSKGKSMPYISKKLNVSHAIVKHILLKHSWEHVSSLYDIDITKIEKGNSSENSALTKLDKFDVFKIYELYDKGMSYKYIVKSLDNKASYDTIRDICKGRTWKGYREKYNEYTANKDKSSTTIESDEYYTIDIHL